ncbi:MAG: IS66 family transposase [Candidatus Freyarchaeota archaeon]
MHWKRCPQCGKPASGGDQVNAEKNHIYGYRIIAYATRQHTEHGTPPTEIAENLRDILKEDAPTAQTVRNWINHTAQKNRPLLPELLKTAKKEKYLEVDETGIPMDGKKNWLWIISTPPITIHLARKTRGHQAVEGGTEGLHGAPDRRLLEGLQQTPPQEAETPHPPLPKTSRHPQRAGENPKQTLRGAEEKRGKPKGRGTGEGKGKKPRGKGRPRKRETLEEEEKQQRIRRIAELRITAETLHQILVLLKEATERKMSSEQAKKRMLTLLDENHAAESLSGDYRRISKPIRKHVDELFLFLEEPDLPCSTNAAEREIKPYANLRRKSPCYRSPTSAEADAALLSYSTTWKKANLDPRELHQLLARGMWKKSVPAH